MNCSDFERIINDLAREQMLDQAQRVHGLAHAESCARCAARLADERALTLGLHTLATSAQQGEASARVEAALVSAFRRRDSVVFINPAARPARFAQRSRLAQRWRWAASIAAAAALLFLAFAASRMQPSTPTQAVAARDSQAVKLTPWLPAADERAARPDPVVLSAGRGTQPQPAFLTASNRRRDSMYGSNRAGTTSESAQPFKGAADTTGSDIATDFIPLTYGADLSSMDSGRVVRVELPRTALTRFGLPMNAERAGEPVKADVLIGEDGLAQAIRFVR
jgi:hypothetical protein